MGILDGEPVEGYMLRNAEVCEEMENLDRIVQGKTYPEGSEAWKYQRMANPSSWEHYGYSVDIQKLMEQLGKGDKQW